MAERTLAAGLSGKRRGGLRWEFAEHCALLPHHFSVSLLPCLSNPDQALVIKTH